jgi:hypothetical protein
VRQQKPRMRQIELRSKGALRNIRNPEFDVVELQTCGFAPAELQFRFVDIRSNHPARRTDHARHVEGHIPATATDLQAGHSFFDTGSRQAGKRRALHHTRENT